MKLAEKFTVPKGGVLANFFFPEEIMEHFSKRARLLLEDNGYQPWQSALLPEADPEIQVRDRFGFDAEVICDVAKESGIPGSLIYAMSSFLYTDARMTTTVALLNAQGIPDLGLRTLRTKMFPAFRLFVQRMENQWLTCKPEWIDHPNNSEYKKIWDVRGRVTDIVGSVDTFPIRCVASIPGSYQPKYSDNVLKGLCVATHTAATGS